MVVYNSAKYWLGILPLLMVTPSCKMRPVHEGISGAADTGIQQPAPLEANDIAVLLPLHFRNDLDAVKGLETTGHGFCSARGFGATSNGAAVLTTTQFDAFSKRVFGLDKTECAPVNQISGAEDGPLIDDNHHVAYYKGLRGEICLYDNWKVVGMRFEPCGNRADFRDGQDKPRAVTTADLPPRGQCLPEFRLIAQPFVFEQGQWRLVDTALHLLYKVPDLNGVVADLRYLQNIKNQVLQGQSSWPSELPPDPRRHTPHPALRQEMAQCDTNGPGVFGQALSRMMGKHATPERLSGIAWMTSDTSPGVWSFGTQAFENGQLLPKSAEVDCVDSFSLDRAQDEKYPLDSKHLNPLVYQEHRCPPSKHVTLAPWVDYEGKSKKGRKAFASLPEVDTTKKAPLAEKDGLLATVHQLPIQPGVPETWGKQLEIFNTLLNPQETSQLGVTHGTNCTSCHLLDNTLNKMRLLLRYPAYAGPVPHPNPPPVWKPYLDKARENTNLRNFGYGPGFTYGVSLRTLYEIDDIRNVINDLFKDVPAAAVLTLK